MRIGNFKKGNLLTHFVALAFYSIYWLLFYLTPIIVLSELSNRNSDVVLTFKVIFSEAFFTIIKNLGGFYLGTFFELGNLTPSYEWLSTFYFFIFAPIIVSVPYFLIQKLAPTFSKVSNLVFSLVFLIFSVTFIYTNIIVGLYSRLPSF